MSIRAVRKAKQAARRERAGKCPQCGDAFVCATRSSGLAALVYECARGHKFRRDLPKDDAPPEMARGVHAEVEAQKARRCDHAGQSTEDAPDSARDGAPVPVRAPREVP